MDTNRLLVAFTGPPALGKSTLAHAVAEKLGIKWIDHEVHIRVPYFGPGHPDPDASSEIREQFNIMQAASYDVLFALAGAYLDLGRPLVVSAVFVSGRSQQNLREVVAGRGGILKAIWCWSDADTDERVVERLAGRKFGEDYFGGVNDLASYRSQKARWKQPPALPHLVLDTFAKSVVECVADAMGHIAEP